MCRSPVPLILTELCGVSLRICIHKRGTAKQVATGFRLRATYFLHAQKVGKDAPKGGDTDCVPPSGLPPRSAKGVLRHPFGIPGEHVWAVPLVLPPQNLCGTAAPGAAEQAARVPAAAVIDTQAIPILGLYEKNRNLTPPPICGEIPKRGAFLSALLSAFLSPISFVRAKK